MTPETSLNSLVIEVEGHARLLGEEGLRAKPTVLQMVNTLQKDIQKRKDWAVAEGQKILAASGRKDDADQEIIAGTLAAADQKKLDLTLSHIHAIDQTVPTLFGLVIANHHPKKSALNPVLEAALRGSSRA